MPLNLRMGNCSDGSPHICVFGMRLRLSSDRQYGGGGFGEGTGVTCLRPPTLLAREGASQGSVAPPEDWCGEMRAEKLDV